MTLLDAQPYDDQRAKSRRGILIAAIIVGLFLIWLAYHLRDFPERNAVEKFFSALEHNQMETAFAVWNHDPDWKQHAEKFEKYSFGTFSQDWGSSGEWGAIKSHAIDCSYSSGSGVIVQVTVNHRAQHAYVWVDKSEKTLHFSPDEIDCGNWWGWMSE